MGRQPERNEDRPVIVVDSSVGIDFFRGLVTPQTERLDSLLSTEPIAVGDLILAEVLQGFRSEQDLALCATHLPAFQLRRPQRSRTKYTYQSNLNPLLGALCPIHQSE